MNAIVPSYIDTNNTAALLADADKSEAILGGIPAGRWGQSSDMATAPYFCSRAHRTTSMALPLPSMAAGWRDEFHSWQAPKCVQLQTLDREHMSTSANGHSTASATSPLACMLRMLDRVNLVARYGVGAVDLVVTSSAPLENTVPETAILSLPYLFDNLDEADKVLQGDAGRHFLNYMEPCGLVGLTFLSAIERSVYTSKKPLRSLADIGNLKLRVMQSPSYVATYEALGAQPTPMAYSEVYLALQNGVVDGAENSPDTFVMDRMTEVSRYVNMTKVHYMPSLLVMSKVRFDALNDEQKAIVRDAAKEVAQASISAFRSTYTASLKKVKEANVEIVETDRAEFAKAARAVWPSIVANTPDGEQNLKIIEKAKTK